MSNETKHFDVDARALLTWGRDSIKDHTTAVLELVKNSYDAGSKVVKVEIRTDGDDVCRHDLPWFIYCLLIQNYTPI